jgi:hypothetical protein
VSHDASGDTIISVTANATYDGTAITLNNTGRGTMVTGSDAAAAQSPIAGIMAIPQTIVSTTTIAIAVQPTRKARAARESGGRGGSAGTSEFYG